jgi:hypothetical protein
MGGCVSRYALVKERMLDNEYLKSIGFSGFVFLRPEERDEYDRLTWNHNFCNGEWITIRLIHRNDKWELDLLSFEGVQATALVNQGMKNKSLEEIVAFVKVLGTDTLFNN